MATNSGAFLSVTVAKSFFNQLSLVFREFLVVVTFADRSLTGSCIDVLNVVQYNVVYIPQIERIVSRPYDIFISLLGLPVVCTVRVVIVISCTVENGQIDRFDSDQVLA